MPSIIAKLEAGFQSAFPTKFPEPPVESLNNSLRIFFDRLDEKYHQDDDLAENIPTGISELDKQQNAMLPGKLIVVASRPSMGKTTLLANIIKHAISIGVTPVAIFSSQDEITTRLIALQSTISLSQLKSAKITQAGWNKLSSAVGALKDSRVQLHASPLVSPHMIHETVKELAGKKETPIIIFDGIDHIRDYWRRITDDDVDTAILSFFSELAFEYKCVFVVTAGLARAVDEREDHRPRISDLEGGGAIEWSADTIWLLYRDEVYNKSTCTPGSLEILTVKSNSTELGSCLLKLNPVIGLIE